MPHSQKTNKQKKNKGGILRLKPGDTLTWRSSKGGGSGRGWGEGFGKAASERLDRAVGPAASALVLCSAYFSVPSKWL